MRSVLRFCAIGATTLLLASPLQAQLIGAPASGSNCFPFGCKSTGASTRYQQIYAASSFLNPIDIATINFFHTFDNAAGNLNTGTFTFYLSTTSLAVNALSTNFASNVGANNALFGVFQLTGGAVSSTLSFTGTPFSYNPANGNLLLDIFTDVSVSGFAFLDARPYDAGGLFSRQTDFATDGFENYGLVTEFKAANVVPPPNELPPGTNVVPEPSTYLLMATGLAALAVISRRRRVSE